MKTKGTTEKGTRLKSVVIVTQYFPPEVGGGAMRSAGIAEGFQKLGVDVKVIAPQPSYMFDTSKYNPGFKLINHEEHEGIKVFKPKIFSSDRKGFFNRLIYYLSFSFQAMVTGIFKIKHADIILTISPPLFTGIVGVFMKKMLGAKLIFDIGDLWPEGAIRLGFLKNPLLIKMSQKMERWIYKHSDCINLVTRKTVVKVQSDHPYLTKLNYLPNFIDTGFITSLERHSELADKLNVNGKKVFGYAGNIGGAQGISIILKAAKILSHRNDIVFMLIGDGIERDVVERFVRENSLRNVIQLAPVERNQIKDYLSLFDFSIIPLLKNELFSITIPSKLYECMAAEIPVILCVNGEARKLVEDSGAGYTVEPENYEQLAETIQEAALNIGNSREMGRRGRLYVKNLYERDSLIADFKQYIEKNLLS